MAKRSTKPVAQEACGCAPSASVHPSHAVGVDQDLKRANLRQLARIEGQVRGIAAMIEGDRYCADIITQVSAVRESLHSVARNLMRNHLQHCAARGLASPGEARGRMIDELLDLVAKVAR
jgi:DNA-binding FrmR family transcriptional regulator